jgi:PAS domain S-box-containing protein
MGRDPIRRPTAAQRRADDTARLAAIVSSADDAIIGKTLDGVITSWNRAAEALFGHTAAEAIGQSITLIIPLDRRDEEKEILARLRRGESLQHFETERITKDGRLIPISLTVSPVRDAHGRLTGASKIARDISDRRRAEQKLESSARQIELLYRLVDQVGGAKDRKGVCEAAVGAIVEGIGVPRASVLLLDDTGTMRFAAWRGLSESYRTAVNGHSPWSADAIDPEPILVDDVRKADLGPLAPVIEAEGIGALGFFPLVSRGRLLGKFMLYHDRPHAFTTDETRLALTVAQHVAAGLSRVASDEAIAASLERERAARQEADTARSDAEAANEAKDEFLAMLGHELRNPLAAIMTSASVVEASAIEPVMRRSVATITRQATHLARLTDDLLDVARITRRRIELERQPVDLRATVKLAWEAQRHHAEAKEQQVTLSLPTRSVMVWGDPVRLQQVVGNLLNNASKYSPQGGSIWLQVGREQDQAVLRLRDDGAGIQAAQLGSIFDLFFQANPTLARTEGGLGIGLTLARRVVEMHGGTIEAESPGLGLGSTFTLRLPHASGIEPADVPDRTRTAAVSRRVLLVEDHDDGREALATLLRRLGHHVEEASTGAAGIEAAARRPPDVVFLDIGLPDIDGFEVARRLRQVGGQRVFLVALTGYAQPRDKVRSVEAGFDLHLVKPVSATTLTDVIERLTADAAP